MDGKEEGDGDETETRPVNLALRRIDARWMNSGEEAIIKTGLWFCIIYASAAEVVVDADETDGVLERTIGWECVGVTRMNKYDPVNIAVRIFDAINVKNRIAFSFSFSSSPLP